MPTFDSPTWWQNQLSHARAQSESVGLPKAKHEAWLYTPIEKLAKAQLAGGDATSVESSKASKESLTASTQEHIRKLIADLQLQKAHQVIVFLNGELYELGPNFSENPNSVLIQTFKSVTENAEKISDTLKACLSRSPNPNLMGLGWSAFATHRDGVVVRVSGQSRLAVVHLQSASSSRVVSQNIYEILPGCEAEICEIHFDVTSRASNRHHICDVIVHENAKLNFAQALDMRSANDSYFINDTQMRVSKGSKLEVFNYSTGASIARHEYDAELSEPGAQIHLYSLTEGIKNSQTVISSNIVHVKGDTQSEQIAKSVLSDDSQFVFSGRLEIAEDAQKSDASQYNHNLLLSDKSAAFTRPQLEVFADDVKAAHGATLGSINPDELFYLQSRALTKEQALKMLKEGYARDLIGKLQSQFLTDVILAVRNV